MHNVLVVRQGCGNYLVTVFYNNKPIVAAIVENKYMVGYAARLLLRDCDKYYTGGDEYTSKVRRRMWDVDKYPEQWLYHKIKTFCPVQREEK